MSMPIFPDDGIDITREQAFNMLLGSIAMEELGLSHIINAEGEKLQYVLGTLPCTAPGKATTQELLEVNRSITALLEHVAHNQFLLKGKLAQVLEAQEKWSSPCVPPETPPGCEQWCGTRVYKEYRVGRWCAGQRLTWRGIPRCGEGGCAGELSAIPFCHAEDSITLVSFYIELSPAEAGQVAVALSYSGGCVCNPILKSCGCASKPGEPVYLSGSAVLTPPFGGTPASCLVVSLDTPQKAEIKKSMLTLTTISKPGN